MKRLRMLLAVLLLLTCLAGCGTAAPEKERDEPKTPATDPQTPDTAPDSTPSEREILPDFTVQTIDGGTYTLSEELMDHDLVIINLFATWCPPCRMEFPYLQEAWEQERNRVSVIALTIEPTDTDTVLREFAGQLGMEFPVSHEQGTNLGRFVTVGIPTTLVVDRNGRVAAVEVGSKSSTQEFLSLFDDYTRENPDPAACTYLVYAYDSRTYEGVEGVIVNFCSDTACTPVTTSESGAAEFIAPPAQYHVQIVRVPDGWELDGTEDEFYTGTRGETFWIPLREAGK